MRVTPKFAMLVSLIGFSLHLVTAGHAGATPPRNERVTGAFSSGDGIAPIAGHGSGGAVGPAVQMVRTLPDHPTFFASSRFFRAPLPRAAVDLTTHVRAAPLQTRSRDGSFDERAAPRRFFKADATHASSILDSFLTGSDSDIAGATDGRYVVSPDEQTLAVHLLNGVLVKATDLSTFYCAGSRPLPVCSHGGFAGDSRIVYDVGSQRWVASALWVYSSVKPAENVLAVSATADPTAVWYLYEFPACGAFDTQDGSDQPHIGFNPLWITVTSACGADPKGAGLAVFDKTSLYGGRALRLNVNWFEFVDPLENVGNRNNPVSTYAATIHDREYLTVSTVSNGRAGVIYSFIDGPVDAPLYYPSTLQVTTSFFAAPLEAVDTVGCQGCLFAYSNAWIHSSGVWSLHNGIPVIVSTYTVGDPRYPRSSQVIAVASSQIGVSRAFRISGGAAGAGPLASEIALPLVRTSATNYATIGYATSESNSDPSLDYAVWNVDANVLTSVSSFSRGTTVPAGYDTGRWTDFMSALTPVPNSPNLLIGGPVAIPSLSDSYRSTSWGIVSP